MTPAINYAPEFVNLKDKLSGKFKKRIIDPRKKVVKEKEECIDCNLAPNTDIVKELSE
jgi:hypothetical protein